jgi:predicted Zn finger-like uncharacterized protein
MRLTCPDCKNAILLDDADAGREVECPRCRGTLRVPELPDRASGRDRPPRFADDDDRRPWQGKGVTALVLGILSVPGAACCGLGGLLGLLAFVLAALSLRTPSRGAAITGLFFSVAGIVLSLGVLVFLGTIQSAMNRPVAPAIDGVQPPFAGKF